MTKYLPLSSFLLVLGCVLTLCEAQGILKAAAPANNIRDCFCQCSSLTFADNRGRTNGNCKTTFNGGQWCYITNEAAKNGDCPNAFPSRRFPGRKWSYFACATPKTRTCVLKAVNSGGCSLGFSSNRVNVKAANAVSSSSDPNSP